MDAVWTLKRKNYINATIDNGTCERICLIQIVLIFLPVKISNLHVLSCQSGFTDITEMGFGTEVHYLKVILNINIGG